MSAPPAADEKPSLFATLLRKGLQNTVSDITNILYRQYDNPKARTPLHVTFESAAAAAPERRPHSAPR